MTKVVGPWCGYQPLVGALAKPAAVHVEVLEFFLVTVPEAVPDPLMLMKKHLPESDLAAPIHAASEAFTLTAIGPVELAELAIQVTLGSVAVRVAVDASDSLALSV